MCECQGVSNTALHNFPRPQASKEGMRTRINEKSLTPAGLEPTTSGFLLLRPVAVGNYVGQYCSLLGTHTYTLYITANFITECYAAHHVSYVLFLWASVKCGVSDSNLFRLFSFSFSCLTTGY